MKRRTYITTAIAGVTALGGCLGTNSFSSTTPSDTSPLIVPGDGDYPHKIRVQNELERDITLTVSVDRDGAQVYQETHTTAAQTEEVVAGITEESLPEDSRSVTVTAIDSDEQSATVNVSISDCLGNIVFFYDSEGVLKSTYSIC